MQNILIIFLASLLIITKVNGQTQYYSCSLCSSPLTTISATTVNCSQTGYSCYVFHFFSLI